MFNKGLPTELFIIKAPTEYISLFEYFCFHEDEPCPPFTVAVVAPHPAPYEPNLKSELSEA